MTIDAGLAARLGPEAPLFDGLELIARVACSSTRGQTQGSQLDWTPEASFFDKFGLRSQLGWP